MKRHVLLNNPLVVLRYLVSDTIVSHYSLMHGGGGIDRQTMCCTERSHRLDVVGVVVRNNNIMQHMERESVFVEILFYCAYAQTGINHQPVRFRKKTIAIAAATATKRYEFKHQNPY